MNRGMNQPAPNVVDQFFSPGNENYLQSVLQNEIQRSYGQINGKIQTRITKACDHYMNAVWEANGPSMNVQGLNREVVTACMNDFASYFRRESNGASMNATQVIQSRPSYETEKLSLDTSASFERLQNERMGSSTGRPAIPNELSPVIVEKSGSEAITLYEQVKKAREGEYALTAPQNARVAEGENAIVQRLLPNPPAGIFTDPNQNPTLALPNAISSRPNLNQDIVVKQDSVVSYRETENNLFIYSADRDWLYNSKENRYNFSVNFDPANNRQGFTLSPSATIKFKNIVRIELVKAIVPAEGLDTLVKNSGSKATPSYDSSTRLNILSFPYSVLRIPELDGNNYGTDDGLNNSFGVIQYDANWISDNDNMTDSKGYLALIPKFQKCQRVYAPAPKDTIQKLTLQLNRPDGTSISTVADTLDILKIFSPTRPPTGFTTTSIYDISDSNQSNQYIFLQTSTYFSRFAFSSSDRIQIKGVDTSLISSNDRAKAELKEFLESAGGHLIAGIGYTNSSNVVVDGPNAAGYANVLIIRSRFDDPTTGSVGVSEFGGTSATLLSLNNAIKSVSFTGSRLINLNRQTTFVLRVITREMDPTSRLRPDNLY